MNFDTEILENPHRILEALNEYIKQNPTRVSTAEQKIETGGKQESSVIPQVAKTDNKKLKECPKCGSKYSEACAFCMKCGTVLI